MLKHGELLNYGGSDGSLLGKVALVTGGAGGAGGAIVAALIAEGVRLVVIDQSKPPDPAPAGVSYLRGDICQPATAARAVATAEAAYGGLDLLVSAASTAHRGDLAATDLTCWNRVLAVNLTGTMLACQAAAPAMSRRGGGAIVTLGRVHRSGASPDQLAYAVSKGAVLALTRQLAGELQPHRIRINCVELRSPSTAEAWPDKRIAATVLDLLSPGTGLSGRVVPVG